MCRLEPRLLASGAPIFGSASHDTPATKWLRSDRGCLWLRCISPPRREQYCSREVHGQFSRQREVARTQKVRILRPYQLGCHSRLLRPASVLHG